MDQTNIMTYFEIKGDDFPIEYVTELLEVNPTNSFLKGEEIKRTKNIKLSQQRGGLELIQVSN